MGYDYSSDPYGKMCLEEAEKGKGYIGFGAVLVKDGKVLGTGRNRLSTTAERALLSHVDYGIHAEQACIAAALRAGHDVTGATVYVLGIVLQGANKGELTVRTEPSFGCRKCPHTFLRFNIAVNIPHVDGWVNLAPETAQKTAKEFCGNGTWKKYAEGLATL